MRPRDTSDDALAVQTAVFRRMSSAQRSRLAGQMSVEMRATTAAGIRARHPDYSEGEVRFALFRLLVGDDLFRRAWPDAPLLAP